MAISDINQHSSENSNVRPIAIIKLERPRNIPIISPHVNIWPKPTLYYNIKRDPIKIVYMPHIINQSAVE